MSSPQKYQRHIDGLRAVAVLSVVFYHFGQTAFSGGFVGVDVFFVISGYLISRLILEETSRTGDFDFKRFYIRRMRRLFPAMAVTFTLSLVFAFLLLSPERLQAFGRSLSAAIFSVSNMVFWSESGYFDADSHLKPLLHTWSLGVEEQFYFIWPALLWFSTRRASRGSQVYVLAAVGLASFGLNALWVAGNFDANYSSTIFYLTPFRIFELVIGATAFFLAPHLSHQRWLHETAMLLGLALIAYAVFTYTDGIVFPYYYALPPCIGALLVILAKEARTVGWLMTNRLAVGVGLISYSMYLVHWPVLVFYSYYRFEALSQTEYAALFIATALLSILMYYLVEKTLRRNAPAAINPAPQKAFLLSVSTIMSVLTLAGIYLFTSDGITPNNAGSLPVEAVARGHADRFLPMRAGCDLTRLEDPRYCDMDKPYQILVIGNSHEPDGFNAFTEVYRDNPEVNLIAFGTINRCDIRMSAQGPVSDMSFRQCAERAALLGNAQFVSRLSGVIYSSNKPYSQRSLLTWDMLRHMAKLNQDLPLVVLGGYINTSRDCSELFNRFKTFSSCKDPRYVSYDPFIEKTLVDTTENDTGLAYLFIDKTALLCSGDTLASCQVQIGDEPAFYDSLHLSLPFATLLGRRIARSYGQDLGRAGLPVPTPAL